MLKKIATGIVLAISLALAGTASAATIMASSCAQADVQAAINSVTTGDTVRVPAGYCTWTTSISIPSSKKITVSGAGIDLTTVIMSTAAMAVNLGQSGSRITGFTFQGGFLAIDGDGWRIDNCKFYNPSSFFNGVSVNGTRESQHPTGLIDHCEFYNSRVLVEGWAGLLPHSMWTQPLHLGSESNVVYVENCTFIATVHSNAIDANYGGRYVFRYNHVTDTYIEAHSLQGNHRATRKWEIYNNTFNQVNRQMWVPMFLRGGTGVVFNNTLTGTWSWPAIILDNVRSCTNSYLSGMCDGSSPWDGNESGGYPCRDQIGRSSDQYLWTSGAPYPPQALDPAYAWNNKMGQSEVVFGKHGCDLSKVHIQENRDYYNNVAKPGYTPYTYPHPLISTWNSGISTPRNFRRLSGN